jgi:serine/threonine protein kinase
MSLKPGEILNKRYRIEETIASGGMGAVYRASDLTLQIQVALKENFQPSEFFIRQFHVEAKLLAGLMHPNLPRVTDHFTISSEGQYLVMDYIDGIDLRQRLAQVGQIAEAEVLQVGAAVCDALTYLHRRQPVIVHRDIKPGNIKITSTGQIYLVDFGLAKLGLEGKTSTGAQAFTPGYSPPEQYGQGTEIRSDIYALGATLYACLTGQIPPDGLERALGNLTLNPIALLNPNVSTRTIQAIEKAMSVRPEQRFASAQEFRAALIAPVSPNAPTIPAPATPRPSAPPMGGLRYTTPPRPPIKPPAEPIVVKSPAPSSRRSTLWVIAALFLLIVIAGGVFFTFIFNQKLRPTPTVQPPTVVAATSTPSVEPTQSETMVPVPRKTAEKPSPAPTSTPAKTATPSKQPAATLSPAPRATPRGGGEGQIAFAASKDGKAQIWLTGVNGSGLTQVTNLPDGACQPDWSPDGARIVFISPCPGRQDSYAGASLFLINANGTNLIPLSTLPGGDFDPAWSPDSKTIAFTSLRSGKANIYLYDLASNAVTRISSPVNIERRPAWSPDSSLIAYETRRNGPSQIWVMNREGKNMREFSTLEAGSSFMPNWAPFDPNTPGKGLIVYSQGIDQGYLKAREYNNPAAQEVRINDKLSNLQTPRFSPDGWWLAYTQTQSGGASAIYILLRNGGSVTLLPGAEKAFHPAWRPANTSLFTH